MAGRNTDATPQAYEGKPGGLSDVRAAASTLTAKTRRRPGRRPAALAQDRSAFPRVAAAELSSPPFRRLRSYAFDPSLSIDLDTAMINEAILKVPWESNLACGPVGEYLEVVDFDPAERVLLRAGRPQRSAPAGPGRLRPSEGNPQFHQQMVYAVAMTDDPALRARARPQVLWSPRCVRDQDGKRPIESTSCAGCASIRTRCARPTPTTAPRRRRCCSATSRASRPAPARRCRAAWCSPACRTTSSRTRPPTPCSTACTAASSSRPTPTCSPSTRRSPTSSRCSSTSRFPEVLAPPDRADRGRPGRAEPAGRARPAVRRGDRHARRAAQRDRRVDPATEASRQTRPTLRDHDRAARPRRDPGRRGVRRLPRDLQARGSPTCCGSPPAAPACCRRRPPSGPRRTGWPTRPRKAARHVLTMCIRALDYCPPVDLTFGEYLRALITADYDLVPGRRRGYRVALIEAFRQRGIYPTDVVRPVGRQPALAAPKITFPMRAHTAPRISASTEDLQ